MQNDRKYNRIKSFYVMIILIAVFCLCGCGNSKKIDAEEETTAAQTAGTVQIYHVEGTAVKPDGDVYQLKQPDNISAALEEVTEQLNKGKFFNIERFTVDENSNILFYVVEKQELTQEQILLNKAAIVKSVESLDVNDIAITLENVNGEEVETATYTDSSFYYVDDISED